MALLPVLVVLTLAIAVGGSVVAARRAARSQETSVRSARRHGLVVAVVAPVAGLVVVVLLVGAGADVGHGFPGTVGDALVMAPLAYAITHTLVLLVGELTWPRPAGELRRARLVPRRVGDVLPRRLTRLALVGTAVLVVELAVGAVLAASGGREITHRVGPYTRSASPWPGWHYGLPVAVELVLLALAVAATLRVVVNRPAVATEDERIEDALRRTSAHRVVRGAGAGMLLLAGALLGMFGTALGSVQAVPWLASITLDLLGDAGLLAGLIVLCLPAPRLPVEAHAVPAV